MRETRLWSLHILVIPIIAVLLGMHLAIMHYAPVFYGMSVEKARDFATMIERGKSVAQFVIYILLLIAGAGLLEGWLGLPVVLMREAGLILVPFVAFVAWAGKRASVSRSAVAAIIAVNVLWVVASICLLIGNWVAPTMLGYAFVIAQAAAVGLLAELQYVGLKRQDALAA